MAPNGEQKPSADQLLQAVNAALPLLAQGRPEAAEAALRQVVAGASEFAPAHKALGAVLLELGRPDQAIAALDRGLSLAPRDAAAASDLATGHWRLGRRDEAVAWLRRAVELGPGLAQGYLLTAR